MARHPGSGSFRKVFHHQVSIHPISAIRTRWDQLKLYLQGSPTYGEHVAVKLSAENKRQFWIPRGFAHGFAVLSQHAIFSYQCDNYYHPAADGGIRFDDPSLNIDWLIPHKDIRVSEKDNNLPNLAEENCFRYDHEKVM